jgi:hypothetical protein
MAQMLQTMIEAFKLIKGGYALDQATKALPELIRAVKETGKKGKIVLVLEVIPDKNDDRLVKLKPDFKLDTPRRSFAEGYAYITNDYKLSKEDPQQLELLEERKQAALDAMELSDRNVLRIGRGDS